MLETLKIKNIAVIDSAEVPFEEGLNILSGETGAGKSIVIEAISLILGSRASGELIRTGCDEAVIEGLFRIKSLPWMKTRLIDAGFSVDGDELLVRRVVSRTGKHKIYLNGSLATLSQLQMICEGLVDLCGQHEHQSLLRTNTQIELLDRYGGITKDADAFEIEFHAWREVLAERETLSKSESERTLRADFLKFQIQELREAELQPGEDEKLAAEKTLLQSGEARLSNADGALKALEGEGSGEGGALTSLRVATSKLRKLCEMDYSLLGACESIDRAISDVEDAAITLNRYMSSLDLDPSRLEFIQERLSRIAELRRKYGTSVEAMMEMLSRLENELSGLENSEERLKEIDADLKKREKKLREKASALHERRAKVAKLLSKSVTEELKDLKMADAKFEITLTLSDELPAYGPRGGDQIEYLVQTNKGESMRPLGKIASGGELSRLMLAIRRTIADRGGIGVYLFDEIDAGIGGQTAFEVGRKLKSVSAHNQVICITHLPQVAAFADHHLSVRKTSTKDRTNTTVVELAPKERKEELARMLGGDSLTKKSLENAAELMGMAAR